MSRAHGPFVSGGLGNPAAERGRQINGMRPRRLESRRRPKASLVSSVSAVERVVNGGVRSFGSIPHAIQRLGFRRRKSSGANQQFDEPSR